MILSLSLSAVLPTAQAPQQVFDNLVASYPWGPQLCMVASDDDTRAFVAAGAAITVLDVGIIQENVRPQVIHRLEIPDCQPVSMQFYHPPGTQDRRLYIAGGTTGLWQVEFCPWLFHQTPVECDASFYANPYFAPHLIEEIVSNGHHRKRCVDLCIVENNSQAGGPLLFALFAALAEGPFPATELKAYRILAADQLPDTVPFGTTLSFGTGAQGPYSKFASGTALASDPGDPDHLYIALGKGGLARVTIGAGGALSADLLSRPGCPTPQRCPCDPDAPPVPSAPPCDSPGESVRDLAFARTPTHAFLYAAFEYNGLVEYDVGYNVQQQLPPANWRYYTLPSGSAPPGYSERVSAMTNGGETVFIALANQESSYFLLESRAPFRNTGLWSDLCVASGVLDPNYDPSLGSNNLGARTTVLGADKVFWFDRDALNTSFSPTQRMVHDYEPLWGTLYMHRAGECDFRLYECTDIGGTIIRQLHVPEEIGALDPDHLGTYIPEPDTWNVSAAHADRVFAASDGVVSKVNPGLLFFGLDGPSCIAEPEGHMFFITPPPNEDVAPVPGSVGAPSPGAGFEDPPNPLVGALLNTAQWVVPSNPDREWLLPADRMLRKYKMPNQIPNLPTHNCEDPALVGWKAEDIPGSVRSRVGWRATMLDKIPLSTSQIIPTASQVLQALRWVQVVSPTFSLLDRSFTSPYCSSDVVLGNSGWPVLVIGIRGGTDLGLKVFQAPEFMFKVDHSPCLSPPSGPSYLGGGEALTQDGIPLETTPQDYPEFREAVTHVELEDSGSGIPCVQWSHCDADGNEQRPVARRNSRCAVFRADDLTGVERRVCIIAAGFVTTPTNPGPYAQDVSCQWQQYYGRALLMIYDVEAAASYVENPVPSSWPGPELLRVCVGPPVSNHGESHAWVVKVKDYPASGSVPARRFAFAGDLLGKLLVYDISGGQAGSNRLYPAPQAGFPYLPYVSGPPYPAGPSVIEPIVTLHFPKDAADGMGVNCVDLEIDEVNNILYCATGRSGVAVVDIRDPLVPQHVATLDTPGMAIGLAMWNRPGAGGGPRLVVGDCLCGLRVYAY